MTPLKINNNILLTNNEKAEALAKQFTENHQNPLANKNAMFMNQVQLRLDEWNTIPKDEPDYPTVKEVEALVKKLKHPKAPGLDKINNRVIKNMPSRGIKYIWFIICMCLKFSYFPKDRKIPKIIPIHKSGKDPGLPISYRPISLLSALSKLLERVVLSRIDEFLENNNVFPDEQQGFRRNKSSTRQLSRIIKHTKNNLQLKSSTAMILCDIEIVWGIKGYYIKRFVLISRPI